jgi:hypothetical protein
MSTDYVVRLAGSEHVDQLPHIEREAATRFGDSLPESVLSHVTPLDSLAAAQQAGLPLLDSPLPASADGAFTSTNSMCCPGTAARESGRRSSKLSRTTRSPAAASRSR